MVSQETIDDWFCREVLPLERPLTRFIARNWKVPEDVFDLLHDVYALALGGAKDGLPEHSRAYLFAIARNLLTQKARRARIVSFDLVADLENMAHIADLFDSERHYDARDALRRTQEGMDRLPPRCREVVRLRKVEGLTTREAAERLGVGPDAIEQQLTVGMRALTDFMLGGTGRIVRRTRRAREGRSQ